MHELCPIEIQFGDMETLKAIIDQCTRNTVIIAERHMTDVWDITQNIIRNVDSFHSIWIDRISSNPTQSDVIDALNLVSPIEPSHIIAIGGGSTLDLAKAVSMFAYYFKGIPCSITEMTRVIVKKQYLQPHEVINITAIPSTAGTGSEMTPWATIWDVDKISKFSIEADALYPKKAVIIPELTTSLPPNLTIITALDSLCHASEAFWSKQSSPVVRDIALRGVELVMGNLEETLLEPQNLDRRLLLMRGALLAGIAFSKTHTTACHSISYPITMHYNVPHGVACAFSLDAVSQINKPIMKDSDMLFDIYKKYGGLKDWMHSVCKDIVSLRLRDYGIPFSGIKKIVSDAFTKGRMDNNPVDLTPEQVYNMLCDVF